MKRLKNLLHHLFVPHHQNNHRAKLLHNSSLSIIVIILLLLNFFSFLIKSTNPGVLGISYSISENELLSITNRVRQENGLSPLNLNSQLSSAANLKAQDMFSKNYWAHFAPDGTTPWNFIKTSGYSYMYAGENLAKGFTYSQEVVDAWMNSTTHKENILSNKYNDIGFAVLEGNLSGEDTVLVVEMFGSTQVAAPARVAQNPSTYTAPSIEKETVKAQETREAPVVQKPEVKEVPIVQEPKKQLAKATGESIAVPRNVALGEKSANIAFAKPLFEISNLSKSILLFIFSSLVFALIIDLIIVERKKIPRLVGHNIDHIMIFLLFILLIVSQKNGFIQ